MVGHVIKRHDKMSSCLLRTCHDMSFYRVDRAIRLAQSYHYPYECEGVRMRVPRARQTMSTVTSEGVLYECVG